ncbi:hypothetical protein J6590_091896 [Homalodisca vitripennis]|nr:hypothetical protein J6590_091896 [Homalodisca vitripennis]
MVSDALSDLTPGIWSHVRLKMSLCLTSTLEVDSYRHVGFSPDSHSSLTETWHRMGEL